MVVGKKKQSLAYEAGQFADVFGRDPQAHSVWEFLNERDNVLRMQTASELGRPAVEALAARLKKQFSPWIETPRIKRMVGHMTLQVMEANGFKFHKKGARVRVGGLFQRASLYVLEGAKEAVHE
tara:strand:+ start:780 stop:1151 length:372 start_codon:yes stop_codon:yes gene_type:complete